MANEKEKGEGNLGQGAEGSGGGVCDRIYKLTMEE